MKLKANRLFGNTGLKVPPIIYGTSYLGNLYTELPYEDKLKLMKRWFECTEKPVVIDTAGKYGAGLALEVIAKGLSDLDIDPGDVIISNKLGWYRIPLSGDEPTFEPGAWANLKHDARQLFGYDEIIRCHKQGNELLGDKYRVQLVSVHDPDEYLNHSKDEDQRSRRYEELLASYRALFDLKKSGDISAVGIGSKDWKVIRELYQDVKFDWVMFANSFTIYSHPKEIMEFLDILHQDGVGIINSALFHGGFLSGGSKFDYKDVDPASPFGQRLFSWREAFNETCKEYKVKPSDACLHFGISHPAISSVALNTSRPDAMNRNAEILNRAIPAEFWGKMKERRLIDPSYQYL